MSALTDGRGGLLSDLSSAPTRTHASTIAGTSVFRETAALLEEDDKITFTTARELRKRLQKVVKEMDKSQKPHRLKERTHRLLVQGATEQAIDDSIATIPFRRILRVWYEDHTSDVALPASAIITIFPGREHEVVSRQLLIQIVLKVAAIAGHDGNSIFGVGSARFGTAASGGGRRSKEGDEGISCSTRSGAEWPNVMIEVGYSEPLRMLRMDAKWWLLNSGGRTKMVIIALIGTDPNKLHFEIWEDKPNPNPRTRHSPPTIPMVTNTVDIDESGVVSPASAAITIPYYSLFDVQNPNAMDITFTTAELADFALKIFAHI
ncbi:hypothetical protein DFH27DRAFT_394632 [Peziza echinospora]|nr:hypothetical protein DFH27DRAFT_394632 [Peziza echinospora]